MKRQKQKPKKKRPNAVSNEDPQPAEKPTMNRRKFMGNAAIYSVGAIAIGGGGLYFANTASVNAKESDLSSIGNGVPAIVQIHDPSCPTCNALRCEARDAVCSFDEGTLQFKVASLTTKEGQELAQRHNVGKITLLLFDAQGRMRVAIPGMNTSENLMPVFERHVARYGVKST